MSSIKDFVLFLTACKEVGALEATCGDMSVSFPQELSQFPEYKPEELSDEEILNYSAKG